ncbi:ribbon-helix-helix domain-containing protein [Pseudochrobactrum sp. HB0163]|uniref:ribbon-helix-helix domain-containing protein n=1 Tax=Pseudochrobactrum sp. HB0163 TaxID=3450708 RepID=UPI003F6DACA3
MTQKPSYNLPFSSARSKARLRKHSVTLHGHATSFSLEDAFYDILVQIAAKNNQSLASLITRIDDERDRSSNLSSSLRLYVLDWVLNQQSHG